MRYSFSMSNGAALEQLNAASFVYLRHLSEPRDNSLRIIVEEAILNRSGLIQTSLPELANLLKDASPIESTEECRTYELYWTRYAAYLVTEELTGSNAIGGYEDETFAGNILRIYSKSHFLDHLGRNTGRHLEPVQHFKLICLNHLIDVAAYTSPEVRVITAQTDTIENQ